MVAVFFIQALASMRLLLGSQETRRFDGIGQSKVTECADCRGEETLDDEYPAPSGKAARMADGVETAGKKPSKSTRERRSSVKDANAESKLGAPIEM